MHRTWKRIGPLVDPFAALLLVPLITLDRDWSWWVMAPLVTVLIVAVAANQRFPRTALIAAFAILLWSPAAAIPAMYVSFRIGQSGLRPSPALVAVGLFLVGAATTLAMTGAVEFTSVAQVPLSILLPWAVGASWRRYRGLRERERLGVIEEARRREKARIARDMHDSLGHELGLIALRASALQVRTELTFEQVRATAAELREGAATAVEQLRDVVDVLRTDREGDHADGSDAPDVEGVVERASSAGARVTLMVTGGEAPPMVRRTVARVVRESLTNATKHAPGAPIAVRVTHTETGTEVTVSNTAGEAPRAPVPGNGVGLVELGERLRLMGGRFSSGR